MQQILYLLLFCYLLPLIGMLASAVTSKLFQTDSALVTMTASVSGTFLESVRTGLATLLIPLITAYTVELRHPEDEIPPERKRLIRFLFAVFILSFGLNGVILSQGDRLVGYSAQVFDAFKNMSLFYTRELLGYISIAIVVAKTREPRREDPKAKPGTRPVDGTRSDSRRSAELLGCRQTPRNGLRGRGDRPQVSMTEAKDSFQKVQGNGTRH
jgi:hypothetical protein